MFFLQIDGLGALINMVVNFVNMQKLINALAVVSFGVSAAVVAGGVYLYANQDSIKDNIKGQVMEGVKGALGGSQLGSTLINGSVSDDTLGADTALPIPAIPF